MFKVFECAIEQTLKNRAPRKLINRRGLGSLSRRDVGREAFREIVAITQVRHEQVQTGVVAEEKKTSAVAVLPGFSDWLNCCSRSGPQLCVQEHLGHEPGKLEMKLTVGKSGERWVRR